MSIARSSTGLRGRAAWALSSSCLLQNAAGRQLGRDLEASPGWHVVHVSRAFLVKICCSCLICCLVCKLFSCLPSYFLLSLQVMGQDLIPEKLKEEFQSEVKCIGPAALSSLVTASATEFEIKWFGNLQDDLCHFDSQFYSNVDLPPSVT